MRKNSILNINVVVFVLAFAMIAGCVTSASTVKMKRETVNREQERAMIQRSLERFDEGDFYG